MPTQPTSEKPALAEKRNTSPESVAHEMREELAEMTGYAKRLENELAALRKAPVPSWQLFKAENDRLCADIERMVRERIDSRKHAESLAKDLNDCCDQRNALRDTLRAVIAMLSQPVQFTETQDSANILRADARCAREMAAKALTERAAK